MDRDTSYGAVMECTRINRGCFLQMKRLLGLYGSDRAVMELRPDRRCDVAARYKCACGTVAWLAGCSVWRLRLRLMWTASGLVAAAPGPGVVFRGAGRQH